MAYSLFNQKGQKKYLTPEERRKFIAAAHEAADPAQRTLCLTLQIPIDVGHLFRREAGRGSGMKPATLPI